MRVLLINPPYQTITSNLGVGHQVPLGLLMVGGPLIDAGHDVRLIDAEARHLSVGRIAREVERWRPDVVMAGHAGSTPAHPVCMRMLRAIKHRRPGVWTVYGGVYPSYHPAEILRAEPAVDVIVHGEGEATAVELLQALVESRGRGRACDDRLSRVGGIAFRDRAGAVVTTPAHAPIRNLDAFRTGWELILDGDGDRYRCFGLGRAAIVQFSRGCPHRCTYCGQHGFWVRWRHRDPVRLVDEIERLARRHGVRFVTLADENPTTLKDVWRRLLEELADRRLPVHLFATIRATDIVRDADILPLYRRAGILYVLMGIESTSDEVLRDVRKGSTSRHDLLACQLLKRNGIFSILGHIVGLQDETWATLRTAWRQLALYDGDYLNAMYVTPHDWTPFGQAALADRAIIEPDQSRWDYRHQVLAQRHLRPWQLLLGVKWLELRFHLRPSRLRAILTEPDRFRRHQYAWAGLHTGLVWLAEIAEFVARSVLAVLRDKPRRPRTLATRVEPRRHALPVVFES